jgi:hypothetical protein
MSNLFAETLWSWRFVKMQHNREGSESMWGHFLLPFRNWMELLGIRCKWKAQLQKLTLPAILKVVAIKERRFLSVLVKKGTWTSVLWSE